MVATTGRERSARLRKPLERVIAHGHPWIWRDALDGLDGVPAGETVRVLDRRGRFLARGLSDRGPIGVRVFTRDDRPIDRGLLSERIRRAFARRDACAWGSTNALRMVHGEGDGIPGLVVDRYAEAAVVRYDGAALDRWRSFLADELVARLAERGVSKVIDRTDKASPTALAGELPTEPVEFDEHGMRLVADLLSGHKTGMFLDHRASRLRIRELATAAREGTELLNLYGYTGAFSIAAGLGGVGRAITVDVSEPALELATRGWALNGLDPARHRGEARRVDEFLAGAHADGRRFGLVVSDPPNFAPRHKARAKAIKAYAKLHRDVLGVLDDGGLWLAASCSSHVDRAAFETTIREAGHAARRRLTVVGRWGADADHPVPIGFPEGEYLSVVLLAADDDR